MILGRSLLAASAAASARSAGTKTSLAATAATAASVYAQSKPLCRSLASVPNPASPIWNLGHLNHVAIAVPDIDKTAEFYRTVLNAKVSAKVPLPEHGVYTVFVDLGNTKFELLHPYGDKSPIANFLKKNPAGGIHHVCIEVDNIKNAMAVLTANKVRALDPEPKIGAHGKPVVFFHPKDFNGVLLELEQK
ncbi:Glyoxalase/Bleomycin resistance protein/Dihydroxybiphenyl dioxygenase [Entophlyctis helioformis]|nr:Glyoxalase/Bleomycin resistance protein/Dihydroxybiphenyl dioxygenase [Entophlyctis helioformis]